MCGPCEVCLKKPRLENIHTHIHRCVKMFPSWEIQQERWFLQLMYCYSDTSWSPQRIVALWKQAVQAAAGIIIKRKFPARFLFNFCWLADCNEGTGAWTSCVVSVRAVWRYNYVKVLHLQTENPAFRKSKGKVDPVLSVLLNMTWFVW